MTRSTKDAWLQGPGDLKEAVVEDVPVKGENVLVQGLAAAWSNQAQSESTELKNTPKGDQFMTINTEHMEVLQFAHGCKDPVFSVAEARVISQKYGPAFRKVVAKIDELSGLDKEAIENAEARFPVGGASENGGDVDGGAPKGSAGPDVPLRAGPRDGDAG